MASGPGLRNLDFGGPGFDAPPALTPRGQYLDLNLGDTVETGIRCADQSYMAPLNCIDASSSTFSPSPEPHCILQRRTPVDRPIDHFPADFWDGHRRDDDISR